MSRVSQRFREEIAAIQGSIESEEDGQEFFNDLRKKYTRRARDFPDNKTFTSILKSLDYLLESGRAIAAVQRAQLDRATEAFADACSLEAEGLGSG